MNSHAERVDIDTLQGNIYPGFGSRAQAFVFLKVTDARRTKDIIQKISEISTSARTVIESKRLGRPEYKVVWLNFAITFHCITNFVDTDAISQQLDHAYIDGFAGRKAGLVGKRASERCSWSNARGSDDGSIVDLLLIFGGLSLDSINSRISILIRELSDSVEVVHIDYGKRNADNTSLLGFKDSIYPVALRGKCILGGQYQDLENAVRDTKYTAPVEAFVLQHSLGDARSSTNGSASQTAHSPNLTNASYLACLRFEVDHAHFASECHDIATRINREAGETVITDEGVKAIMVGRWPSGLPFGAGFSDNGNYSNVDRWESQAEAIIADQKLASAIGTAGYCPAAAHVQKMSLAIHRPRKRKDLIDYSNGILRRGIPMVGSTEPEKPRGLMFVSYQRSLERQFEFLLKSVASNADYPEVGTGCDPVIGLRSRSTSYFTVNIYRQNVVRALRLHLNSEVFRLTAGDYFLAPPLNFLSDF
ncbi:hypothetical protein AB4Z52_12540 [Rhizobium sp. 2YAF20]|uniref:hypothetical protein n=1 Tax=Rhizobium sp. 2YAF20 TaxID=3233027 RepID=UPI003F96A5ED